MIGSAGMTRTYLNAFLKSRNITKVKVYSPQGPVTAGFCPGFDVG